MDNILENDIFNIEKKDDIYEMVFSIVTNITLDSNNNEIKLKQFNIIEKIIGNIIEIEKNNEDNEKYRRIKVDNPNIALILKIKGVYDFLIFLGFKEDFYENNLTLYLSKECTDVAKLEKALYYMNLLHLNFIDTNNNDNLNYYETPSYKEYISKNSISSSNNTLNLAHTISKDALPNSIINNEDNNLKEAERILKETGQERYKKALEYSNNNSSFFTNIFNFFTCGQCRKKYEDDETFFREKEKNEKNNIMTLQDLEYKNPMNTIECKDEIGKKCLLLTNKFREKYSLPPLEWDDSIWRIAYVHSKNMGEGIVPFGHKGFNERINQFNFTYYKACENVYMCQGYSRYNIAENAVNGWINSYGHKKNLLSDTSHCAIATYKTNYGAFYLTQLFALK